MVRGFWLLLGLFGVACGGISTRSVGGGADEGSGGASQAGTKSSAAGTPSSAGAPSSAAGTPSQPAGGSAPVTMPTEPAACFKDSDCPSAACGGEVCNWNKISATPMGDRTFVCNPAGSQPKGQDGWCVTDADCKCRGLGARCIAPYCSFTQPGDAPDH